MFPFFSLFLLICTQGFEETPVPSNYRLLNLLDKEEENAERGTNFRVSMLLLHDSFFLTRQQQTHNDYGSCVRCEHCI